ncbi:MAG: hydrogenase maturation nickel metallochaperone HypA [Rhodocyclaceae bacterium]
MHEMSLAQGVLDIIEEQAAKERFSRCRAVCLEIGVLSGVEVEAMRFCFDAVTRGSLAEGAALEIVATPGSAWCMQCAASVTIAERYGACPRCGGWQLQVNGGTQMRVRDLEVE